MTRRVLVTAVVAALTLIQVVVPARADPTARQFRVYATREGLVGGTTANGHVIRDRDHFAALPSRRGLSGRDNGDLTVRVCATNGRCEWAPVWDVGPWNTKDDYWNDDREMWGDLPTGTPQAQAAYENGYNGGTDQFGRHVGNPAAVDLADGTFWDGLHLDDNSWVTVLFVWTGTAPTGTVAALSTVHNGPRTTAAEVGLAAPHARVPIACRTDGEQTTGTEGTSTTWYRLSTGKYLAAAHVAGAPEVGYC
ncbi:hypothetical protein [Umezawaea tangerina]|uniref:Secreted protein n=1 Tax=Umezawaea tangerina TaxID=84725 RepID=A0A2T0TCQ9_9PSEU|nr:hypothetical protein [Umezawaea tangerina]PRY43445.1 hypothetical protein CLV43_103188 [Umezawaea tangerina]